MSGLRYLCLFAYSGVQRILCYVFVLSFLGYVPVVICVYANFNKNLASLFANKQCNLVNQQTRSMSLSNFM
jgi:hypothetical protein